MPLLRRGQRIRIRLPKLGRTLTKHIWWRNGKSSQGKELPKKATRRAATPSRTAKYLVFTGMLPGYHEPRTLIEALCESSYPLSNHSPVARVFTLSLGPGATFRKGSSNEDIAV